MTKPLSAILFSLCLFAPGLFAANAEHILVVEIDGLSPESLNADDCPTLFEMARRGTVFRNHHGTFPASVNAAIAEIATGAAPGANGILADREFRGGLDPVHPIDTASVQNIRSGDAVSLGRYLAVSTLPEVLRSQTPALDCLSASSEQNFILADRSLRAADSHSVLLAGGNTLPGAAIHRLGPSGVFPPLTAGSSAMRDEWTVSTVTDILWAASVPPLSSIRLSEPYFSARRNTSAAAKYADALYGADSRLSALLAALGREGVLDRTDVIVVSGLPPVSGDALPDIAGVLRAASLPVLDSFSGTPPDGSILVVQSHDAALVYIAGHEHDTAGKVAQALRKVRGNPVLFSREGNFGALPLAAALLDSPDAPDFLLARHLAPGGNRTLMVAMGPDFKPHTSIDSATSNADIAPTVLWILGIDAPKGSTGRVLSEALSIVGPETPETRTFVNPSPHGTSDTPVYFIKGSVTGKSLSIDEAGSFDAPKPPAQ